MNSEAKRFLLLYEASELSHANTQVAYKERQLEDCERDLARVAEKEAVIKAIMLKTNGTNMCIPAALEWQAIKEDTLKLSGKSVKLHKELSQLKEKIQRLDSLRKWASNGGQ